MRTTLTLEPDVAEALRRIVDARDATMKSVVNEALRRGLPLLDKRPSRRRFRTRAVSLRPRASNVDDVAEVLALAEGDDFR